MKQGVKAILFWVELKLVANNDICYQMSHCIICIGQRGESLSFVGYMRLVFVQYYTIWFFPQRESDYQVRFYPLLKKDSFPCCSCSFFHVIRCFLCDLVSSANSRSSAHMAQSIVPCLELTVSHVIWKPPPSTWTEGRGTERIEKRVV